MNRRILTAVLILVSLSFIVSPCYAWDTLPIAEIVNPYYQYICVGDAADFDGVGSAPAQTGSYDPDNGEPYGGGRGIDIYGWWYGYGNWDYSSGGTPSHTYDTAGAYWVYLYVYDDDGGWRSQYSDSCRVYVVEVDKVVKSGTADEGPLYVCLNGTVDLQAKPNPAGASFPTGEPHWSIENQPSRANATLNPSSGSATTTLGNLTKPEDYIVKAKCGNSDTGDSITVTVVEVASLLPDEGTEFDDGDADPDTKSFAVCIADTGFVTVTATPNPSVSEENLPGCWTLTGGTGSGKLTRTVDKTTPGITTITCTAGSSSKTTKIYVVEVASLLTDEGTEVDDGDSDPNTKRYFLFKATSGNVTVTATSNPDIEESKLPPCWSLTGGTGSGKLTRTIDKTTAGTTEITCTAGSSQKKVKFHVVEATVSTVGFTSDHMITEWGGSTIDDPDGSAPIWGGGADDPVCYTKNTSPTMFAGFTITPNIAEPNIPGISVRAKVGGTIIGSASGCKLVGTVIEDGANTDGDVDGISGGSAVPNSNGVKTLTPTFTWEVSDDGTNWFSTENTSGPHTMYWTDATPGESPLYDRGLEHACEYVDGDPDIADEIRDGIHNETAFSYDPGDGTIESNPLSMYNGGGHVCADFANLMAYLARTVGLSGSTELWWGGIRWSGCDAWVRHPVSGATIEHVQPGDHTFSYHAVANVGGVQDAALNTTSVSADPIYEGYTYYWLDITTTSLPDGVVGTPYSQGISRGGVTCQLLNRNTGDLISNGGAPDWTFAEFYGNVAGGNVSVNWSISSGTLPTGLSLNSNTGVISGTPTTAMTRNFTVKTTDPVESSYDDTQNLSITVNNP